LGGQNLLSVAAVSNGVIGLHVPRPYWSNLGFGARRTYQSPRRGV